MQFSHISEDAAQAMSIKYNTMVYGYQRMGKKVTVLSLGEAFFDIPLFPMEALPFPKSYHYSDSRGTPELRQKLSEYFLRNYDVPINYEKEIIITAGSKAAIHFAFMATVNPGDEVLIHEPYWVSYPEQVRMCHGVPVPIPYYVKAQEFEKYITPRTKVIVINNPHNPTGYIYSEAELRGLLELAEKHHLWIFCDEAYSEFAEDGAFVSLGRIDREKKHAVVFNSISKNYGISGWRLGYVIGNEKLMFNILKINQHLITCPATILEHYVERYFYDILTVTNPQIRALLEKRSRIGQYMRSIGLETLPGSSTFYFFVSIAPSRLSSEEFSSKLLHEHFISVVPGIGYGETCDAFIRVSIGSADEEDICAALSVIKQQIVETSAPMPASESSVLVVAGGLWQVPLIRYLKAKHHRVHVVDPYLHSPGVHLADCHIACDVRDYEEIERRTVGERYDFITTDQSDISVNTVARLNQARHLPGNPPEVTENFVNKYKMRLLAESLRLPVPKFARIDSASQLREFIAHAGLPVMLKPADSQSSRGVVKIEAGNLEELENNVVSSLRYSNCGYLIAEEFLEGREITVEGFASGGRHRTLAISLKKHFRTGIASELRYPGAIPESIAAEVERINDAFVEHSGLRFGITHAEYMVNIDAGTVTLVEIACRGGGTLISSDIVRWVSGVDLYELLYANLRGAVTDVKRLEVLRRPAVLKFFEFAPGVVRSISGADDVRCMKEIISFHLAFKAGDRLHPASDDRSRQGYFIAFAETSAELDETINTVMRTIRVDYE